MHHLRRWRFYIVLLLSLSSCSHPFDFGIDIIEHAYFRRDGSGKFSLIIDLKKCRMFIYLADYISQRHTGIVQAILQRAFKRTKQHLQKVNGVSLVTAAHDPTMLYFKLSFHFESIKALNAAMQAIHTGVDQPGMQYFHLDQHTFARNDPQGPLKLIEYYQKHDNSYVTSFDLRLFFRNMTYVTSYLFEGREVESASHPRAKFSKSRRRVVVNHCCFCPEGKKLSVNNEIVFHTK